MTGRELIWREMRILRSLVHMHGLSAVSVTSDSGVFKGQARAEVGGGRPPLIWIKPRHTVQTTEYYLLYIIIGAGYFR